MLSGHWALLLFALRLRVGYVADAPPRARGSCSHDATHRKLFPLHHPLASGGLEMKKVDLIDRVGGHAERCGRNPDVRGGPRTESNRKEGEGQAAR